MTERAGQRTREPSEGLDHAAIGRLRLVITRLHRQMVQASSEQDLTMAQLSALARIDQYGPLRLSELAALEGVAAPSMIRTIAPLKEAGLVGKEPDLHDGRSFQLTATAAGRDTLNRVRRERSALLTRRLDLLTPDQREILYAAVPVLELLVGETVPPLSDERSDRR
ncbi:MarR family transcriptional regulator [Microtetraspora sp. NBRC 13810]|uniref:MarR family winged helix-turn-helix transcriptional regulator n=1 Tax=Microtetraspora sp. NBRC 13810 TaxID=3030990 RepID=UPI0024A32B47|nr:MarR family transcriptional regulator [Microtetraspora sp. NBRC 13810]GLW11952.1 MarR family transcriptional regulator [Microtetraspora sp. NBRC 13810]